MTSNWFTANRLQRERASMALVIYDSGNDLVKRYERGYGNKPVKTHEGDLSECKENWAEIIWAFLKTPHSRFAV